jgi:NADPH:quinone reductase-like Zn-dependent oxidoreductase
MGRRVAMKAMVFDRPGGTEGLREAELGIPEPGPSEVLVRVAYCGVNPLDRIVLSGAYPAKPMPHILGSEVGGRIETVGRDVEELQPGDGGVVYNRLFDGQCTNCLAGHEETCARGGLLGVVTQGGYAEYMVVPAANFIPIPERVKLEAATAATLSGHTAWHMVLSRARVAPGEWVCIFGATGAVGSYALQLATLAGARAIAVTRDERHADGLKDLGAQVVVVEEGDGVTRKVVEATGGQGADVVVDPVGRATWASSFACVATNGRWTTCGALTGAEVGLDLQALYSRQVELIGSTGGNRQELRTLLEMVGEKHLKVPIWRVYPLKEARQALEALSSADRFGKVLLEVG